MRFATKLTGLFLPVVLAVTALVGCESPGSSGACAAKSGKTGKIKAIVLSGGHEFDKSFWTVFEGYEDIEYVKLDNKKQTSEIFDDVNDWDYDVIVLFNSLWKISPRQQQNFLKLLDKGVGVVTIHHAIIAFTGWPEAQKIIGASWAGGTYEDDVPMNVHIEDPEHPITRGMSDFAVVDETYNNYAFENDNHVIVSTDNPKNRHALAWVRKYLNSRVCYIQFGHSPQVYVDANYRRLVIQAIRWSAGRL